VARYPANQGGPVDVESSWALAQCKHVKRLSLVELERLALDAQRQGEARDKAGLVVVKRRAGAGRPTPRLVVMTEDVWRRLGLADAARSAAHHAFAPAEPTPPSRRAA
jgi:hypothetical protein